MTQDARKRFLLRVVFVFYIGFLAMVTLLPTSNIAYESSYNLLPLTNIDNYIYDIVHSGIINWEFLATKPTDAVSILYNTFTYSFRNLAGNIALFIPLGLLYPLCRKKRVSFPHILIVTVGTTALIELLQFAFLSSRSADVDDLILNFIGGMIGYLIYKWIE